MTKKYEDYTREQLLEEIKKLKKKKKFGLVWEEKTEEVAEQCKTNFPVLQEVTDLAISGNNSPTHLILEGDNYHSLSVLNVTHKGKIDVIYIDPPYNTGNKDFKYNDSFVDKEDSFRHSKWLSFMHKRLQLAKELLSENGVIFISIDDNEQAQLKLLCDEILGENNFIALLAVENNPKGRKNQQYVSGCNDYCLIYAKDKRYSFFVENIPKNKKDMALDENGKPVHNSGKRVLVGEGDFNKTVTDFQSKKHYTVYYNYETDDIIFEKEEQVLQKNEALINIGYERYISFNDNEFIENTYTQDKLNALFDDGALEFKNCKIYEKNFRNNIRIKSIVSNREYKIYANDGNIKDYKLDVKTTSAIQGLKLLFNTKKLIFNNPKNEGLLKLLLTLSGQKELKILDFFAGSGTTGHAVLELNKEDGGNRQFILCTNNENNICEEVTYPRIKTVITGERPDGTKYSDGISANVRYFKTDFVEKSEDTDENRIRLTNRCYELLQIKESCYESLKSNIENLKLWQSNNKLLAVIFDRYDTTDDKKYISEIAGFAHNSDEIVVYRFSIDGNLEMDISALPNARIEEIPEEILKTFNQIFKPKKKRK